MTDLLDVALAEAKKGVTDHGTNTVPYWAELQPDFQGEPWCAAFVSWCAKHSGEPLPAIDHPWGYSYCPDAVAYAKTHQLWDDGGHYQRGDIIFFDWDGDGLADHTGLVLADDGATVITVEGNTGPETWTGDQSNGDGVYQRHRTHGSMILGVLAWHRVIGKVATAPSQPTATPGPKPTQSGIDDMFKTKDRDTFHSLSFLVNGNAGVADKLWIYNPGLHGADGKRLPRGKFDTYLPAGQTVHIKWAHRPVSR